MSLVCTSGRRIDGLTENDKPCGRALVVIGHGKTGPVRVCAKCDETALWPKR